MCMLMMYIRHMRMTVSQSLMNMPVAVRPKWHGNVVMVVVSVVVIMGMLMIKCFMFMLVTMTLSQVKGHTT